MEPEKQRIAIAKTCGITHCALHHFDEGPSRFMGERDGKFVRVPDYLNHLNAMHEAEKVAGVAPPTDTSNFTFEETLANVERTLQFTAWLTKLTNGVPWAATAAQRAEAFLRTFNLWTN